MNINTFEQDVTIPIYITLSYFDKYPRTLKFPINPEQLKKEIDSSSETVEIEGLGEVSIQKKPALSTITIESMFWSQTNNLIPSAVYVRWLETWQKSQKEAVLLVTRLNYSMLVTCESFSHWINAGEEEDIYFSLSLKEFRPYGAQQNNVPISKDFKTKVKAGIIKLNSIGEEVIDFTTATLIDVPKNFRNSSSSKTFTNPYTIKKGDTLISITRSITGSSDDWASLYDENKTVISKSYSSNEPLETGTKLTLPQSWVSNSGYRIINGG